jgi:hypothetical protein
LKRNAPLLIALALCAVLGGGGGALLGLCGPFTDVAADAFCPFVLEIFTLGITTGTSPTTYDPTSSVSRLQMAAFLSRSVDGVLKRGSRSAALGKHWRTTDTANLALTTVGTQPRHVRFDGADLWVANADNTVSRVRASDGKLLENWTGATFGYGVLPAMGKVFITGVTRPGNLYRIDPSQPAGEVTTVATNLVNEPIGLAFDGARIWTGGNFNGMSIVTPGATIPWTVTTFVPIGSADTLAPLFDGTNIWVPDRSMGTLLKLDAAGAVLQTVTVGNFPGEPVYDGANIWVPNSSSASVSVVRASTGAVLATLTGNGLSGPLAAAFDGQTVLVTDNFFPHKVSLWKAADLTPLCFVPFVPDVLPTHVCSDGVNFWIVFPTPNQIARF